MSYKQAKSKLLKNMGTINMYSKSTGDNFILFAFKKYLRISWD